MTGPGNEHSQPVVVMLDLVQPALALRRLILAQRAEPQRARPHTTVRAAFWELAANGPPLVLDGEIALPDERGVTDLRA